MFPRIVALALALAGAPLLAQATVEPLPGDERDLDRIADLEGALDLIARMRPRTFEARARPGVTERGLVAQELSNVLPRAVSAGEERLRIDDARLTPILVAGIQELSELVEAQRREIESLREDMLAMRRAMPVGPNLTEEPEVEGPPLDDAPGPAGRDPVRAREARIAADVRDALRAHGSRVDLARSLPEWFDGLRDLQRREAAGEAMGPAIATFRRSLWVQVRAQLDEGEIEAVAPLLAELLGPPPD
mgnify:CR=1 FL=1